MASAESDRRKALWADNGEEPLTPVHYFNDFGALQIGLLDQRGGLGSVIMDVGSCDGSITRFVDPQGKKIIDISIEYPGEAERVPFDNPVRHERLRIGMDIEALLEDTVLEGKLRRAIVDYFGTELSEENKECVDTMIFSQILNYIDYKKVLRHLSQFLRPKGQFIIYDLPRWGHTEKFAPDSVAFKSLDELRKLLQELGFEIETDIDERTEYDVFEDGDREQPYTPICRDPLRYIVAKKI